MFRRDRGQASQSRRVWGARGEVQGDRAVGPLDALSIILEEAYAGAPVRVEESLRHAFRELTSPKPIPLPEGLQATLRPYQETGYQWLYHNFHAGYGPLIADDMGLGKTIQVIGFLLRLKEEGLLDGERQALIVVPASLVTNWRREIERFAPSLAVLVHPGNEREEPAGADLVVTTYSLAARDHGVLSKRSWRCVICDEAQNIKNPATTWTKAVKGLGADLKIAMTGTPVENRLPDSWSVLDFAMPRLLGTHNSFKERFAVPIEKFKERDRLDSFRRITAPFILRRLKTDKSIIDDLPEKVELDCYAVLTPEQARLYQGLVERVDELRDCLSPIGRRGLIFRLISGLKQICNNPALYLKQGPGSPDRSGKMGLRFELIGSIVERGEKLLVFSRFKQMGDLLFAMIEEKINAMLLEKRDLADLTVSRGEKWIGELSNRELVELLSLERE